MKYWLLEGNTIDAAKGYGFDAPPVVTLTAYWKREYDVIQFNVYGSTYCDVCIDVNVNRVVYPPISPTILKDENGEDVQGLMFYGWDCSEGDYLPGVDRNQTVICGDLDEPLVDGDGIEPIICKEDEVDYSIPINAYVVQKTCTMFKVTFKYMSDSGVPTEHIERNVPQNKHLPRFHIHNKYVKDGSTFAFKHWILESGNLTSSLTVLSDLVFVAVYDET